MNYHSDESQSTSDSEYEDRCSNDTKDTKD